MPALLLRRSEVHRLLDAAEVLPRLREGFIAHSRGTIGRAQRVRSDLPGPGTATVLFPGSIPRSPFYTVKVHAKFPAQRPAIRGALCLHSNQTGELLAIMDSTHLTGIRTGLSGALAAHILARPQEVTIYGGVGLAFQDAVCASAVYTAALQCGSGEKIDFLS